MSSATPDASPYDALLLVSFGGPERPDDVLPFLENVTRGKPVPRARLLDVAQHYQHFGGRSPINDQNRALLAAIRADLAAHGVDLPVAWGNRNWTPYLVDALRELRDAGARRVAALVTSAYASYSGCRQYREDLAAALAEVPADGHGPGPRIDKLRHYFDAPGFVAANADALVTAAEGLPHGVRQGARVVAVTHSIPIAMAATSGPTGDAYVTQHEAATTAVLDAAAPRLAALGLIGASGGRPDWDLVYCSRSGPPRVPWLEPDVNDSLRALAAAGVPSAVLLPLGFVSDHMEVAYDLDTEALATAHEVGLPVARAATAGTHPAFVRTARELLLERAAAERGEPVVRRACSPAGPSHDVCPVACCADPRASGLRRAAVAGAG